MTFLLELFYVPIRDFFSAGGPVLYLIMIATILMWTLIIERLWFFFLVLPRMVKDTEDRWNERMDTGSWNARQIRQRMISQIHVQSRSGIPVIKALMAVLPLMGLLGTVVGMIGVFDVMASVGTGNARLMAGGVSKATIPTMSGLVAALSGLYPATWLDRRSRHEAEKVEDLLVRHH